MRFLKKLIKIKGQNNQIISPKIRGNGFYDRSPVKITGNNNLVSINPNNQFYKLELIINGNNNSISVDEGCWGSFKIIVNTDNTTIKIGKNCVLRGAECGLWEKGSSLIIGDEVMIARDSRLYVSDFHSIVNINSQEAINQGKFITIGNHVWIGERVFILKNNKIADDIMVAAGSVVTKDLTESHSIYAGNPAKLVKSGVTWNEDKFDDYQEKRNAVTCC